MAILNPAGTKNIGIKDKVALLGSNYMNRGSGGDVRCELKGHK
jgi:hypothetical protein